MRKLTIALAGATIAGSGLLAGAANAQYYYPQPVNPYYDGAYRAPVDPYYAAPVDPYYRADPYYGRSGASTALSVLGSVLGLDTGYSSRVPVDRFGPDPNGMIAPDGHRIKCKLRRTYDSYYRGYVTRRVCR